MWLHKRSNKNKKVNSNANNDNNIITFLKVAIKRTVEAQLYNITDNGHFIRNGFLTKF